MSELDHVPMFATQGGGLATIKDGIYVWSEVPNEFPEMKVGDSIPEEWSVVPINRSARDQDDNNWGRLKIMSRPSDCICEGWHTDSVDESITTATLEILQRVENCPAERRALARIIASRF